MPSGWIPTALAWSVPAEAGLDLAVVVEAAVERAVEVVAGECEVVVAVAVVVVGSGDDDLAAALERRAARGLGLAEARDLLAVAGEARVERAVRFVTGEGEVAVVDAVVVVAGADGDDPPVGLDQYRRCPVAAAEARGLLAVAGEARVQPAVRVVTDEAEVGGPPADADSPATTILPSGWIATASAKSASASKSVSTRPADPNSGSRLPSGL